MSVDLGAALAESGRHTEALHTLRAAVAASPVGAEAAMALGNIGLVLLSTNRAQEAIAVLQAARNMDADVSPDLVSALADAHVLAAVAHGNGPKAAYELANAMALRPDDEDLLLAAESEHINSAVELHGQGNLAEAASQLRAAIRLNPNSALGYRNLGKVLLGELNSASGMNAPALLTAGCQGLAPCECLFGTSSVNLVHLSHAAQNHSSASFSLLDGGAYASATFLDVRSLSSPAALGQVYQMTREQLLHWSATCDAPTRECTPRLRWIFHLGHCGSTLLSRALNRWDDAEGEAVLVLREPVLLRPNPGHDLQWLTRQPASESPSNRSLGALSAAALYPSTLPGGAMLLKWLARMPLPCDLRNSRGTAIIKPSSDVLPEAEALLRLGDDSKAVFLYPRCASFVAHGLRNQADYFGGPDETSWMGTAYFDRHVLPVGSTAARLFNSSQQYGGDGAYDMMVPEERLGLLWSRKMLFASAHLPSSATITWERSDVLHDKIRASVSRVARFFDLHGEPMVDDLQRRQATVGIKGEWRSEGDDATLGVHEALLTQHESASLRAESLVWRLAAELRTHGEPELAEFLSYE